MIVRNEAQTLRRCLESVRGMVTEMVIGDTGSTDGTPSIAREYGARVIEIPWDNDFATARNLALAAVNSDWVLSLDADEMLDFSAGAAISALISAPSSRCLPSLDPKLRTQPGRPDLGPARAAERFQTTGGKGLSRLCGPRKRALVPAASSDFFVGRVHESVGPQVEAAGASALGERLS